MSRNTIRVLHSGRHYVAGHDAVSDDRGLVVFSLEEGAADRFTVDWRGYLGATAATSVVWTSTAGAISGEALSANIASMILSGLTYGDTAEIKATAAASPLTAVVRFRVHCGGPRLDVDGGAGDPILADDGAIYV